MMSREKWTILSYFSFLYNRRKPTFLHTETRDVTPGKKGHLQSITASVSFCYPEHVRFAQCKLREGSHGSSPGDPFPRSVLLRMTYPLRPDLTKNGKCVIL